MVGWESFPSRPLVMGILNVTPDSFSDGGDHLDPDTAIAAGRRMVAEGADILDIGGESTRPGSDPTPPEQEQARILPVIAALRGAGAPISVDTRNAATMAAVLDAGAAMINDVSALQHDPAAAALIAARGCLVILMHMRGTPATMNSLALYDDVAAEVADELGERLDAALTAGISREQIALDPGIGFAKRAEHNVALLSNLQPLLALGRPLVAGVSRKRFIGAIGGQASPKERLAGSLAAGLFALRGGARVLRVHDVAATVESVRVWHTLSDYANTHG
jgi:dihydropteroate synthase